jgi:hypothetical protein
MKQLLKKIFFFSVGLLYVFFIPALAQDIPPQEGPTSGTDIFHKAPPKPTKEYKSSEDLLQIVKRDTKKILYGNKCFEEYTYKLGFEYVVEPFGRPESRSEVNRFFHNFGVKFILIFKSGPFWKSKVNKRIRNCRVQMGDFAG